MKLPEAWPILLALPLVGYPSALRAEPLGPAFTYQGQLLSAGTPADGPHDFEFRLYDSLGGAGQVGGAVPLNDVDVVDGLFTVTLNAGDEFGASAFNGNRRWLEIRVDGQALTPRQEITPAPFALYAPSTSGFWSANGSHIFNSNTGNVGIGTNSPTQRLDVNGNIRSRGGDFILNGRGGGVGNNGGAGRALVDGGDGSSTGFAGLMLNFANDYGKVFIDGDVGIGTTSPGARLDVDGPAVAIEGSGFATGVRGYGAAGDGTSIGVHGIAAGGLFGQLRGIGVKGESSTNVGVLGESIAGLAMKAVGGGAGLGAPALSVQNTNATGIAILSNSASSDGNVIIANSGGGPLIRAFNGGCCPVFEVRNDGRTIVPVLEITGADLAEKFPSSECVEPGMVVEIDPDQAGQLRLCRQAYNRRVAGVVSGAGGLSAGTILGNLPGLEDAPPIALSGRVWTYCDAGEHAISPGDLLTTSTAPGHAMKALDGEPAHGAILGKAMSRLEQGKTGLVLVLVNLQ